MAAVDRQGEPRQDELDPRDDAIAHDLPPDEQFWEKYSKNYEFPLSTFGAIAAHIVVVGLFILYVSALLNAGRENVSPPIRSLVLGDGEAAGDGTPGSGAPNEAAVNDPMQVAPPIPDAKFQEIQSSVIDWVPDLKSDPELVNIIARSPEVEKLKQVNDELRKKLLGGMKGEKGKGSGTGSGNDNDPGAGSSGKGDGSTTGERSLRWNLKFQDFRLGEEYLEQVAQLKGKIIYPVPPKWDTCIALTEFKPGTRGTQIDVKQITEMYYICQEPKQVQVLADALQLNFTPPYYVLLLPREIEDHLAALETSYRNRKSEDIQSTTFAFVWRDGKVIPMVIEQTLRRK